MKVNKPIVGAPIVGQNVSIEVPANVKKTINLYEYAQLTDLEDNELFYTSRLGSGIVNWAALTATYNLKATWSIVSVVCEDGTSSLDYDFSGYTFTVNDETAQTFVKTYTVKAKIAVTGNYGYNESSIFECKLTPVAAE